MQTNTNQNRISKPAKDTYRELVFEEAFGIKSDIIVTNENTQDWNWVKVIMNFKTDVGNYGLIEYFKDGKDNSTNYVVLEDEGKEIGRYKRFVDAEVEMVRLIKEQVNGNSE